MPERSSRGPIKPQPTLKGYSAWVVNRLVEAKGITQAEAVAWILDRWIDANRGFLEEEFEITRAQYKRESSSATVLPHPATRATDSQ